MLTCTQCQNTFVPNRTNKKNPQKYCSVACANFLRLRKSHPCPVCSKETTNPKFCSSSCAATHNNTVKPKRVKQYKYKICLTCGTQHTRPKYCSDSCNPQRLKLSKEEKHRYVRARANEAWQRYMAKKKNQTPPDADIAAIREFYLNCPDGHEVDHIHPLSKGGLHTLANLQYLTIRENRKKSNKIL